MHDGRLSERERPLDRPWPDRLPAAEVASHDPGRGPFSFCRLCGGRGPSPWQRLRGLAAAALVLLCVAMPVQAAAVASSDAPSQVFRCEGLPLTATLHGGAVDDPAIPNRSGGTLPGAFVQLQWQQAGEAIALQLPRTNNSGPPSFTDGKWWWSLEDPNHPRFRLRQGRGEIQDFACEPA